MTFPESYGNEKLAGKAAQFEIELIKVEEPTLPEIDAEFIKSYGVDDGEMTSFRADIKANMERELKNAIQTSLKNSVMDALFEKIQVALPNALVDQEIESMMKPYQENAKKQKLKLEDLNLPRDVFEEQARRRVALGLILSEIIKQNEIKIDEAKVRSAVEDMAQSYEHSEDVINWYYSDQKRLDEVRQMVLEDQTVEWITAQAKVTDEKVTFDDIMNKK